MHTYRGKVAKRSPFVNYACSYFSHHLRRGHSEDVQRFVNLCGFLDGNVCSWIEYLARTGSLHHLVRTAKDFKGFLQARAKYHSPIGIDVQKVDRWVSDLVRLVAQFGRNLTESPSAIFWLIPPFCPPMTAIGARFGSGSHGIIVNGLSSTEWSDRISSMNFRDRQTRAVACTNDAFAVGLSDRSIKLYSRSTCQEIQQLRNSQPAKLLAFSVSGKLIACSSVHYVTMYSVDGEDWLWQTRLSQECLTFMFADQDKIFWLVTKGGTLASFSVSEGTRLSLVELSNPLDTEGEASFCRIFTSAACSLELNMVAATQRGRPIGLYDIENGSFLGACESETDGELESTDFALLWIRDLVFNPNPANNFIAALYHDGDLVLFDPCEMSAKTRVETDGQVLASSPDGCTLATGSNVGAINIFEFESLTLIYKIVGSDHPIKSLAFSSDGLRFLDIRGSQCNVW